MSNWRKLTLLLSCGLWSILGCAPSDENSTESILDAVAEGPPQPGPSRVVAITDLPPLDPPPSEAAFQQAIATSRDAGATGAVLTYEWSDLEPASGQYRAKKVLIDFERHQGRVKFLGIQCIHTAQKSVPSDLTTISFDDPRMRSRFRGLLQALAPLLKSATYLSVGNESDVYLAANRVETNAFARFLKSARSDAREISPHLQVGTTITADGLAEFQHLSHEMDVQIVNYYHMGEGFQTRPVAETQTRLRAMLSQLDERPIVIQEVGYAAAESLGGSEAGQAQFVDDCFELWQNWGQQLAFVNFFMMTDFPREFGESLVGYYQIPVDQKKAFVDYFTSLGLRDIRGRERPAWQAFKRGAAKLNNNPKVTQPVSGTATDRR
jgi:hypothetical protein